MAHPLPSLIKIQIAKDLTYGLLLGAIPGLYFKQVYVNRIIKEREAFYANYDKSN